MEGGGLNVGKKDKRQSKWKEDFMWGWDDSGSQWWRGRKGKNEVARMQEMELEDMRIIIMMALTNPHDLQWSHLNDGDWAKKAEEGEESLGSWTEESFSSKFLTSISCPPPSPWWNIDLRLRVSFVNFCTWPEYFLFPPTSHMQRWQNCCSADHQVFFFASQISHRTPRSNQ